MPQATPIAPADSHSMLIRGDVSLCATSELLAVVLRTGPASAQAMTAAEGLLEHFGGLRAVLNAHWEQLAAAPGVGDARLAKIRALRELARRYFEETLPIGAAIKSPADTETFLLARLRDRPHEVFCCLYLDNRHRVILFEEMFRGTIDGTSVYPREVVKMALQVNAAAVILAHNHPSGIADPSQADERITRRVKAALNLVDIRLLDHLVIGDGISISLASRGLL
ncbi:MAG: DNA repair protein RadC [Woeseia sp.]|jgi:DNA repair protein RadC|nr:DNA repair protein RadC [Woeseia sp.]MBT6209517.1 DNA repair protein RadC [Woeseia sp.]